MNGWTVMPREGYRKRSRLGKQGCLVQFGVRGWRTRICRLCGVLGLTERGAHLNPIVSQVQRQGCGLPPGDSCCSVTPCESTRRMHTPPYRHKHIPPLHLVSQILPPSTHSSTHFNQSVRGHWVSTYPIHDPSVAAASSSWGQ